MPQKNKICNCGRKIYSNSECCDSCSRRHREEIYIIEWLKSGATSKKPGIWIRRYLLSEQNNQCAICGMENVWNNKDLIFVLDHIDGNNINHSKNNLRLICSNCNSQTTTFAGRNRGCNNNYNRYRKKYYEKYNGGHPVG